jgi:hypothetical protein
LLAVRYYTKLIILILIHLCLSIEFGLDHHDQIIPHFDELKRLNKLPNFEALLDTADRIRQRYMTLESYEQALCQDSDNVAAVPEVLRFPLGEPYTPSSIMTGDERGGVVDDKVFRESEGFTGDRVLANSILFMWEYSLWIEFAYALPQGDIGRVFEILKVSTFPIHQSTRKILTCNLDLDFHFRRWTEQQLP